MANLPNSRIKYACHLYKVILKLHRGLPSAMQHLGNEYVKKEFRRHKEVKAEEAAIFLNEWTIYANELVDQLNKTVHHEGRSIGKHLTEKQLHQFHDNQIGQLHELMQEINKPIHPKNS